MITRELLTIRCPRNHVTQVRKLIIRKLEPVFMPGIRMSLPESGSTPANHNSAHGVPFSLSRTHFRISGPIGAGSDACRVSTSHKSGTKLGTVYGKAWMLDMKGDQVMYREIRIVQTYMAMRPSTAPCVLMIARLYCAVILPAASLDRGIFVDLSWRRKRSYSKRVQP